MIDVKRQYPIGKFTSKPSYSAEETNNYIEQIAALPEKLEKLYSSINSNLLNRTYREGGWTGLQVIHHLADSHMNAYIRCKWTLTENNPVIKAYDEKAWAVTPETQLNASLSINLLHALHKKWVALLRGLTQEELNKQFVHPETHKQISINQLIALYAWHGEHHLGHLKLIATGHDVNQTQ
ncbi:MAG: putative metal-dependent hydrolase [Cyclobacteriaceae bacterium]|jgi:hypothetical protein|nr:putative metal-dependent hydrolase [Cyclobacteriaceae bacterium]